MESLPVGSQHLPPLHICRRKSCSLPISPYGGVIEQEKLTITEEKTKKAEELIKVDTPKRFKEYDERLKEIVKKNDEWKTRLEAHIVKLKGLLKAKNEVCALFLCTWSCTQPTTYRLRPVYCLHAGHAERSSSDCCLHVCIFAGVSSLEGSAAEEGRCRQEGACVLLFYLLLRTTCLGWTYLQQCYCCPWPTLSWPPLLYSLHLPSMPIVTNPHLLQEREVQSKKIEDSANDVRQKTSEVCFKVDYHCIIQSFSIGENTYLDRLAVLAS